MPKYGLLFTCIKIFLVAVLLFFVIGYSIAQFFGPYDDLEITVSAFSLTGIIIFLYMKLTKKNLWWQAYQTKKKKILFWFLVSLFLIFAFFVGREIKIANKTKLTINFANTDSLKYEGVVVPPITTPLDAIHFILKKEHENIKKQMDENRPQSELKISAIFMDERGKRKYYDLYQTKKKNNMISQEKYEQLVSEMKKEQPWWEVYVFATNRTLPSYSCEFSFFENGEAKYNGGCRWNK